MQINKLLTPYNFTDANNAGRVRYIVIHYVGALGGAKANCQYYARQYIGASAHYFVGFEGEIWQSVADEDVAWHCGASSYKHGECRNSNSIGIELCVRKRNTNRLGAEDKDWYFEDATVESAAELTRYLMDKYGVPASHVIRHYDVTGKICPNPYVYNETGHTWDEFKKKISGAGAAGDTEKLYRVRKSWGDAKSQLGAFSSLDNAKKVCTAGYTVYDWNGKEVFTVLAGGEEPDSDDAAERAIWEFLTGKGLNAYAAAGLMGNLFAESGLNPCNLQNSYNNKLGMDDAEYTQAVDTGTYDNFINDKAGYGLAQWTYYTRKQALLLYAHKKGASIGNLYMQLGFLWEEMQGYKSVMATLKAAASVRAASDAVLLGYERPADQSEGVQKKRAGYGEAYYKKYAGTVTQPETPKPGAGTPFKVRVDINDLRIRTGAGTGYTHTGEYTGVGVFTITEVKAGKGSTAGWGKLKSGAGWVSLDYCTRLA